MFETCISIYYLSSSFQRVNVPLLDSYDSNGSGLDLEARVSGDYSFAMTGRTWAIIRDSFPDLLPRILVKGAIFARMTSEQKQQLIQELQHIGYHVGEKHTIF